MKVIPAYFDGNTVRPLTQIDAKKNQLLYITILDSYLSDDKETIVNELCGSLHEYANPELIDKEKSAWEEAAVVKHAEK